MAAHKEDLRIIKTRTALSKAFFELLTEMELNDITVNILCEKSGVRRATFYKHFKDKTDFVLYIVKDFRAKFDNSVWDRSLHPSITKEYYTKYAEALLAFLLRHETAMKRMATSPMRSAFIDLFLEQNYNDTTRLLAESEAAGMKLVAPPDVVASMLIGGTSHCIIRWFESDDKCPPEELLKHVLNFMDRILS